MSGSSSLKALLLKNGAASKPDCTKRGVRQNATMPFRQDPEMREAKHHRLLPIKQVFL
jgi:hypothetical protein